MTTLKQEFPRLEGEATVEWWERMENERRKRDAKRKRESRANVNMMVSAITSIAEIPCYECGAPLPLTSNSRSTRFFCSDKCRQRNHRREDQEFMCELIKKVRAKRAA